LGECLDEIDKRRRLIQGLVITGGEPLLRADIGEVVSRAHDMGLPVKLDTNGPMPGRRALVPPAFHAGQLPRSSME